ncbi:disease resistance-like protein DSC1 [Hevea brasiliensis]|uniref:disease resistance-like protein DSC1 n=1 Tax=Hevea brasiliensis TaxID=3981 RepID=UPI0025F15EE1|nr:disease resistance-like protein DSC1 [Hevea brasiliensis]
MVDIPDCIGYLFSLEVIDLSGNSFCHLPHSIRMLTELQYLGLRDCKSLRSITALPPQLTKLDADNCFSLRYVSIIDSTIVEGKIFEFLFTNCRNLHAIAKHNIMTYALTKFQLYSKRLHNQMPSVRAGESGFCFPGSSIPKWFSHQSWGLSMTIQLPSHWANSEFLGFALCAVIAFNNQSTNDLGFQVKCRYHFRNDHGDCNDLYCYFGGCYGRNYWEGEDCGTAHTFFGIVEQLIHSLGMIPLWMLQEMIGLANTVWSTTEGPMRYDEENMVPIVSWLKSSVLKLNVFRHRHFGCFDVIDQKELDLLTSEIITDKSQKHHDMEELVSACQVNEFI